MKGSRKFGAAVGFGLAALLLAGTAQAASGSVTIQNNTTASQNRTGSFGTWATLPGTPISSFSSSVGSISFPNLGVIVNDVTYRDPVTTKGCNFRVQTQITGSTCSVVLTRQPVGTFQGTQATCSGTLNSVNSSTCDFSATFTISGF